MFVGTTYSKTASYPDGYGIRSPWAARTAGSMSSSARIGFTISGNLLAGGPMTGSFSSNITSSNANLSLIASLTGGWSTSLTSVNANLAGVVQLTGSGSWQLAGSGNLGATVPMSGSGSFGISGYGDVRMKLSLTGGWTPYTELSPENLAAEVWNAAAANYNDSGTMGNKLNSAASGGVDYAALGQAVWSVLLADMTTGGSAGEQLKKLLTTGKYIALKG